MTRSTVATVATIAEARIAKSDDVKKISTNGNTYNHSRAMRLAAIRPSGTWESQDSDGMPKSVAARKVTRCICGCGEGYSNSSKYGIHQGHDVRFKGQLQRDAQRGNGLAEAELRQFCGDHEAEKMLASKSKPASRGADMDELWDATKPV